MISQVSLFKFQANYGVGKYTDTKDEESYEVFLDNCRRAINLRTTKEYHNMSQEQQVKFTEDLIVQYVTHSDKAVTGFVENGIRDNVRLINQLKISILDFGILGEALKDEEVQEIQINDYRSIWVVRNGRCELYRDKKGVPYRFVSNEELFTTIHRLCYNPNGTTKRMTEYNPLMNTRTNQGGYRVSGVHPSAITPDVAPFDFPITQVTIRKHTTTPLSFSDLVNFGSLTDEMVDFLKKLGRANCKVFFIGPVSSGKTTLLGGEMWEIPRGQKVILIQNPTELLYYDRDMTTGTNMLNSVHWEAIDIPDKDVDATKNTMSNLIAHSLRNSPDTLIIGESRAPAEFYEIYRAIITGTRVLGTYHSEDGESGLTRFATEVAMAMKGDETAILSELARNIDCFVTQYKLDDHSRKVMGIELPTGEILSDGRPELIKLFTYVLEGKSDYDEDGNLVKVHGHFEQSGVLREDSKLVQKFYKAGYSRDDIAKYLDEKNIGRRLG